jgi:hypothetical protein
MEAGLPAAVAITPILIGAFRDWSDRAGIWLWGDQALIDIEARNSLAGHNLLGVYDRYGWHHLGPLWLLVLGVARWLGGGSAVATALGFYFLQALAVVAIVMVAYRMRRGLTGWWAALVLVGYEWSFGLDRLGTIWAPYAIALPTALLVLLVADVVVSRDPWPSTIGTAVCASFLAQTDVGTVVVVLVLVVAAPLLRATARAALGGDHEGGRGRSAGAWGWATAHWRSRAATLTAIVGVLWLPPVIQQLSTSPGNLVQAYRFLTTHHSDRTLAISVKAADTLFGLFPFRLDEQRATHDARPGWLLSHPIWDHPWYLLYLAGMVVIGIGALRYRKLPALAVAAATCIAILAAGWSIVLAYGPLYPYLVLWTGALVVPAWIAAWLLLAPAVAPAPGDRTAEAPRSASLRRPRLLVPVASVVAAGAVCAAFVGGLAPLTDGSAHLGRLSWDAVAKAALAPKVKTVYVDIVSQNAMPEAAAIADELLRHHRRLEFNRSALFFVDPSFTPRWPDQLKIIVCCGQGDPGGQGGGTDFRAMVGGQRIYTLAGGPTSHHGRSGRRQPVPGVGRPRFPGYPVSDVDYRRIHAV